MYKIMVKNCPKCHGHPIGNICYCPESYAIECVKCHFSTRFYDTMEQAVEAWNGGVALNESPNETR